MDGADATTELSVPDRFENLREVGLSALTTIVAPIDDSLKRIDLRFADMRAARRGSLMILYGDSGAGKSTFLDTLHLFRADVTTQVIPANEDIASALAKLVPDPGPNVVVLEGREALGEVSATTIEAGLHAINSFVRSSGGKDSLVVWPTNTKDLTDMLSSTARSLGGDALLGLDESFVRFIGVPQREFVQIAERTVAALNEGASLASFGISSDRAEELAGQSSTIGSYLARVRRELIRNGAHVRELLKSEKFRLWTLVIAGNQPEGDVAALTRGGFAYADVDRLVTATGANVVSELKRYPDKLGILGTMLDARILFLDMLTVLSIARKYGGSNLHTLMKSLNMLTTADAKAEQRLRTSELGLLISGNTLGTRRVGGKPGDNTLAAFNNLATIARDNDGLLNRAIGEGLKSCGLVSSYQAERTFGTGIKLTSDLYLDPIDGTAIRLEVMWRTKAGRADIANYVLTKLGNYGKAISFLD